jgi:hypothetical protein
MDTSRAVVPVYTIYDRDIPREHLSYCIIVNPIGPPEDAIKDRRPEHDKSVAGCEGGTCLLREKTDGAV